ncbi:MAG: hypothetical protein GQ564_09135 [Bacteroidales bacterium]|nr:hypothetical protein [Bacteroidales bacterium]
MKIPITKALVRKTSKILFLFLFFSSSCSISLTKDDYLNEYELFVLEIKQNWKSYSNNDWNRMEVKNEKFFNDDYKKFAGVLKPNELIRVYRFNFVYKFYKGDITIKALLAGEYNKVFKGITLELNEIIRELKLAMNDFENEKNSVIIEKLLE